jgi:hypothetical protein
VGARVANVRDQRRDRAVLDVEGLGHAVSQKARPRRTEDARWGRKAGWLETKMPTGVLGVA